MKIIFTSLLIIISLNLKAQVTTTSFKLAAKTATTTYNKNKECVNYVKTLTVFLKANASKYRIIKYTVYKYSSKRINIFLVHDYDAGKTAISDNGIHYVVDVDGYIFDNNHPEGQLKTDWEKLLECVDGTFPIGFNTRISVLDPSTLK